MFWSVGFFRAWGLTPMPLRNRILVRALDRCFWLLRFLRRLPRCLVISCLTGWLNDVYVAVITLAVTLALYYFVNSTSEEVYKIGNARLMGFNGISGIPPVNWPGDPNAVLSPEEIFYLSMGTLIVIYLGLHGLLRTGSAELQWR